MDPGETQSPSLMSKPLNECTAPSETEKILKPIDNHNKLVDKVESLTHLPLSFSENETQTKYQSEDEENSTNFEMEKERLRSIYLRKKLKGKKRISTNKDKKKDSLASKDHENSDNSFTELLSQIPMESEEVQCEDLEQSFMHSSPKEKHSLEEENAPSGEDEMVSSDNGDENSSRTGMYGVRVKSSDTKASTIKSISETDDKVVITLNKVCKKTVIRVLNIDSNITYEKYRKVKGKYTMDNGKWDSTNKVYNNLKIFISPRKPVKLKIPKDRFQDCDYSDADKENHFEAESVAENVMERDFFKGKLDLSPVQEIISSIMGGDNSLETSISSREGTSFTDYSHTPSPSMKRVRQVGLGAAKKKIRTDDNPPDEDMKNEVSDEEKEDIGTCGND